MLWVCRAGQKGCYFIKYIEEQKIYLPWDGYRYDLSKYDSLEDFRRIVAKEKQTDNHTSISNWSGQLFTFVKRMQIGDHVMIPSTSSQIYVFAKITGEYQYQSEGELHHSRSINIIKSDISRTVFSQNVRYSLGAYRTVFQPRYEEEIVSTIMDLESKKKG